MKLNARTPKQSLNKAFLKQPVNRDEINSFKANLQNLLGKINENESEEHHKDFVRDFLKSSFYKADYEINTKGRQDLVIHVGTAASDKVGVILEAKKPTRLNNDLRFLVDTSKAFESVLLEMNAFLLFKREFRNSLINIGTIEFGENEIKFFGTLP